MSSLFPRQSLEHTAEPKALRRISRSLVEMAVLTGVAMRVFRVLMLTHGSNNWLYLGGAIALGAAILLGMLTAHLGNYPLHQYFWRAPLFAVVEVAAEMAVSALLIAFGHEAMGPVRAHWDDWPGMALNALLYRGVMIVFWGLMLAGLVQILRETVVHEEDDPEELPAGN